MQQNDSLFFKRNKALPFVEMRRADHSNACYHTHSHDEFSFGVIDAGEADYRNQRAVNHIGRGHTVLINPGDAHSCNPKKCHWSYRMLFVDAQWVGNLQKELLRTQAKDYQAFPQQYVEQSIYHQAFSQLFESLLDENNPLEAETRLVEFLGLTCNPVSAINQPSRQKFGLKPVERIRDLIMDSLDKNVSLEEFSSHSGLSRYHLIRSFKSVYGQSPHAFQLDQRIKKAKALLRQGNGLADIATSLGFADQSHFQRNFKKRLAVTPKQYQAFFC